MQITSVDIMLWEDRGAPSKIRAFCSVIFDGRFVVHDIKVIDGPKGLYVAMPSRRLADHCPSCKSKTPYLDKYCGSCGCKLGSLEDRQTEIDARGKRKVYVDVAHPLCADMRAQVEDAVMEAYWGKRDPVPEVPSYGNPVMARAGVIYASGTPANPRGDFVCVSGLVYASGTSWN